MGREFRLSAHIVSITTTGFHCKAKSSYRQYFKLMNVVVFNKILFAKTSCGLDLAGMPKFADPGVYPVLLDTCLDLEIVLYCFC